MGYRWKFAEVVFAEMPEGEFTAIPGFAQETGEFWSDTDALRRETIHHTIWLVREDPAAVRQGETVSEYEVLLRVDGTTVTRHGILLGVSLFLDTHLSFEEFCHLFRSSSPIPPIVRSTIAPRQEQAFQMGMSVGIVAYNFFVNARGRSELEESLQDPKYQKELAHLLNTKRREWCSPGEVVSRKE